jgi:hypothetical protein
MPLPGLKPVHEEEPERESGKGRSSTKCPGPYITYRSDNVNVLPLKSRGRVGPGFPFSL